MKLSALSSRMPILRQSEIDDEDDDQDRQVAEHRHIQTGHAPPEWGWADAGETGHKPDHRADGNGCQRQTEAKGEPP